MEDLKNYHGDPMELFDSCCRLWSMTIKAKTKPPTLRRKLYNLGTTATTTSGGTLQTTASGSTIATVPKNATLLPATISISIFTASCAPRSADRA